MVKFPVNTEDDASGRRSGVMRVEHSETLPELSTATSSTGASTPPNLASQVSQELKQARYMQRMAKRQRKIERRKLRLQGQPHVEHLSHTGPRSPSHAPTLSSTSTATATTPHANLTGSASEGGASSALSSSGGSSSGSVLSRSYSRGGLVALSSSPPKRVEPSLELSLGSSLGTSQGILVRFQGGVQSVVNEQALASSPVATNNNGEIVSDFAPSLDALGDPGEKSLFGDNTVPFQSEIEKWRTEFVQFEKFEKSKESERPSVEDLEAEIARLELLFELPKTDSIKRFTISRSIEQLNASRPLQSSLGGAGSHLPAILSASFEDDLVDFNAQYDARLSALQSSSDNDRTFFSLSNSSASGFNTPYYSLSEASEADFENDYDYNTTRSSSTANPLSFRRQQRFVEEEDSDEREESEDSFASLSFSDGSASQDEDSSDDQDVFKHVGG